MPTCQLRGCGMPRKKATSPTTLGSSESARMVRMTAPSRVSSITPCTRLTKQFAGEGEDVLCT